MEFPKAERTLRVGLVQMNTVPCEAAENRKTAERLIRRAAEAGADLVVLPETWNVGFFPRRFLADLAEPEDGESRALLSRLAKELGVAVAGGSIPTRRGGSICNTFVFYTNEGRLTAEYDKLHAFSPSGEGAFFRAGDRLCLFSACGVRAGVLLCYDLRFCEQARLLALGGAGLLLVCAQWPRERLAHWRLLTMARAVENQAFVLAVNGCGMFEGVRSGGGSIAVSPWGEVISEAGDGEELVLADLQLEAVREARRAMNVLADRRPELYEGLSRPVPDALSFGSGRLLN